MNKTALAVGAAALTLAFAGTANASEISIGGGVSQNLAAVEGINLDDGNGLDVTLGLNPDGPLRFEGRVARVSNDTNFFGLPVGIDALKYSGNAFVDLDMGLAVVPYVGAGVEYTDAEASVFGTSLNASGWGWNTAAGIRAPLTERLTADLGVRYGKSDLEVDFLGDVDVEETNLRLGFDYAL